MNPFKFSWVERVLGVVVLLMLASILFPVFNRARENDGQGPSCSSRLKQIGLGLLQYTQDYDDKLPSVATQGSYYGWADVIQPYVKTTYIFQCPVQSKNERYIGNQQADPTQSGYTDYFCNAQLQKRETSEIGDVTRLIMVAEGNDGIENTDARYAKTAIPAAWRTDSNSPSFRHLGSANYLFVDGHVKAYKVEKISTNWSATKFYFQPKR